MAEQIWTYEEKSGKVWSLIPKPTLGTYEDIIDRANMMGILDWQGGITEDSLNRDNYLYMLRNSMVGLGHTREIARARMEHALMKPRSSNERMYQQSFIEAQHKLGPLAVVAYTAANDAQPEEWVVEGFRSDEPVPYAIHTLPMLHPTVWGIDVDDQGALNVAVDHWFPA